MALCGRVSRDPTARRTKPGASGTELRVPHPHLAALEVEHGQWERRDGAALITALLVDVLCLGNLPALGIESRQRREGVKTDPACHGVAPDRERVVVTADCLIDSCALAIDRAWIQTKPFRRVEIRQGLREPMQRGP